MHRDYYKFITINKMSPTCVFNRVKHLNQQTLIMAVIIITIILR